MALAGGRARQAARLLGRGGGIRDTIGTVLPPCEAGQHTTTEAGARAALGAARSRRPATRERWPPWTTCRREWRPDDAGPADPPGAAEPGEAAGRATPGDRAGRRRPRPPRPTTTAAYRSGAGGWQPKAGAVAGTERPGPLRIRALGAAMVHRGEVAVTAADWGYAKPRELLFLLAASPPMTGTRSPPRFGPTCRRQQLGNALHTALRGLRRALGDAGWVVYADGSLPVRPLAAEHECDCHRVRAARWPRPGGLAPPPRPCPTCNAPSRPTAATSWMACGLGSGRWAAGTSYAGRSSRRCWPPAGCRPRPGRHQAAAAAFRRAVAQEPLNESAHRELMACWVQLGETARAVRHYEELVQLLRDQVGVAPAAETAALYRKLMATP